jgi:uncharacterized protein
MPADLRCPTCSRPLAAEPSARTPTFPFCSARCRDRDFGAWMNGEFTVAGEELGHDPGGDERWGDRDRP